MTTSVDEMIEFLGIAASKGFLNEKHRNARRTACNKLFDILDPEQKNVGVRARQPGRELGRGSRT